MSDRIAGTRDPDLITATAAALFNRYLAILDRLRRVILMQDSLGQVQQACALLEEVLTRLQVEVS